jgi:pimeloyl-ACP methyl ester carboxylesterase
MATFVLVHGSFHAAWNWHKLVPVLRAAGHVAVPLDLPAHGRDSTSRRTATLAASVRSVLEVVDRTSGEVVLVAHSRSGVVISQAAEARAQRIHGLVYLAAYLVPNGKSMMDYCILDTESLVVRNVRPAFRRGFAKALLRIARSKEARWLLARALPAPFQSHALRAAAQRDALYHDCPEEIRELARVLLEPEPTWAGFTPLQLTEQHYARVPKVYIECTQDRAVTLSLQRLMQRDTPCDRVFSLDSSHSPFFSQPEQLGRTMIASLDVFDRRRAAARTVSASA